ncbi:MAG TPA: IclR family transcriptional regulator [Streptosporangiaceae bacterium]|jgi:DNA-binding IclR family transcriptional regulator
MGNRLRAGVATPPLQSVDRAAKVLEILAREGEAGVSELATELEVHASTAFRLVSALESREMVEQNTWRGKYRLGVGILRLAGATATRLALVRQARPVCDRLTGLIDETVNIAVLINGDVLYVDQSAGSSALQTGNWIGQRVPVHATSNGKVLLAYLPDTALTGVLHPPLEAFTQATVTGIGRLRAELADIRANGCAVTVDELEIGMTAIAAPIRDAEGQVVASLGASGPGFRFTGERFDLVREAVRTSAQEISQALGCPA